MVTKDVLQKAQNNKENEEYWDAFYKHFQVEEESTFCKYIKSKLVKDTVIVDIGCGTGRDTFSFYKDGYSVFGIDRSSQAIAFNKQYLINCFENREIYFKKLDILSDYEFIQFLQETSNYAKSMECKLLVYSRFFLHSINVTAENILLNAITEILQTGDLFAAEFRTIEDFEREKVYNNHYRRYIDSEIFIEKLETQHSFEMLEFSKGTGFSPFKGEDPFLARVFAKKI
ncbi:class I SAM-dependent methyltransferase [Bacillus sp. IITD106]|nr:class I SAM-dependent methyltransferase [Bacillus sp. IITD106]